MHFDNTLLKMRFFFNTIIKTDHANSETSEANESDASGNVTLFCVIVQLAQVQRTLSHEKVMRLASQKRIFVKKEQKCVFYVALTS